MTEEEERKPPVWTYAKHPRFGYIYLLDEDEHVIAEFTEIDNEEKVRIASCAPEAIRILVDVRETWEIGSEARDQIDALLKKAGVIVESTIESTIEMHAPYGPCICGETHNK